MKQTISVIKKQIGIVGLHSRHQGRSDQQETNDNIKTTGV